MSKKITTKEFQEKLNNIFDNQFELVSEYITNNTKIKVKCNKCGNVIEKIPVKMTGAEREGCYVCSGRNHYKTKNSLQIEVNEKFPQKYQIIGEYIKARLPLLVKNNSCGHEYMISPDNLLRGKGCPRCSLHQSSYMNMVETYLSQMGITFEKEKRFEDCKYIRSLPFDYYIPSLNCCIEVDGEFHYERGYRGLNIHSEYYNVKQRDKVKDDFCEKNKIKLIRLPYYEKENFLEILKNELQVDTEITAKSKGFAAL